jgi:hypothetical protein
MLPGALRGPASNQLLDHHRNHNDNDNNAQDPSPWRPESLDAEPGASILIGHYYSPRGLPAMAPT